MRYRFMLLVLATILVPSSVGATSFLIEPDGSGDFATIQDALIAAASGDTIRLADGTFTGPGNRNLNYLAKTLVVESVSGDPSTCTIDCENSDRGFTFVSVESPQAKLIGVTVTRGIGDGAAIYCERSNPTIENCVLSGNNGNRGGGIHCRLGAHPTVRDCVITDNRASSGGGLWSFASGAMLIDTILSENTTSAVGGGIFMNSRSSVSLTRCTVNGNTAPNTGGGIYCGGAPTQISDLTIVDCEISGNSGPLGGALFINSSNVTVETTVFAGNLSPSSEGGAIYCASSSPDFVRCTFAGNHAESNGGTLLLFSSNLTFDRCVLWGNCADALGDEIYFQDAVSTVEFVCSDVSVAGIVGPGTLILDANTIDEDPIFCGPLPCAVAPTIEGIYTLDVFSPAAAQDQEICGLIGALDVDCDVASVDDTPVASTAGSGKVFPNPTNGSVRIRFAALETMNSDYQAEVYDTVGRVLRSFRGELKAGTSHEVVWDGTDATGQSLPSGSYYYRLRVADQRSGGQIVLLRR